MLLGDCRLCLRKRALQDSHFMPRAMYKRLRDVTRKNSHPIVVTNNRTARSSKQVSDYLLCAECEQKFNKGGEAYLMGLLGYGRRFPLRDRLDVAVPLHAKDDISRYSGTAVGIDTGKLAYFALSMVWRGAVHEWTDQFGNTYKRLDLGSMEESIRQYLLGESPYPCDAAVVVHVCDDQTSREVLFVPWRRVEGETSFEMMTCGVHFYIFLGQAVTEVYRALCCVNSIQRIISRRDWRERLGALYKTLEPTSKRSPDIEAEWPD